MTDLDDIYSNRILELAAEISHTRRLKSPNATASAHSKLCGSTIDVDVSIENGRVSAFGQDIRACLLGQVAASVVGREIIGSTPKEIRQVAAIMHDMLKNGGTPPQGRWQDLEILQPVKDYPARHASTMLVFEAVDTAISIIEQGN